jgi:ATP-dependent Clp protease ATP-binding subunit ClpA
MTQNRGAKRAIRSRMAQTGEKYTEARRAVLASDGSDGGATAEVTFDWPDDSLGWFTDQAYNAILLAADEARMLGQARVDPEHLLLAISRSGNVERLLAREGIDARAIHAAVVRIRGFGDDLVLGPLRRSPASEDVLRGAVTAAAARGTLGPSTEHLLLALVGQPAPMEVLGELGVVDVRVLVDAAYPISHDPIDPATVERRARQLVADVRSPPSPGPIPPVFERFTAEAHHAVDAGVEHAGLLDDPYVEPVHLLLGLLDAETGVVADVRARNGWQLGVAKLAERPMSRTHRATGIFDPAARRIVAEDVLGVADRFAHRDLSTGHLLLAILENPDEKTATLIDMLPDPQAIATEVTAALPGDERT